jgi:hypothetical protein
MYEVCSNSGVLKSNTMLTRDVKVELEEVKSISPESEGAERTMTWFENFDREVHVHNVKFHSLNVLAI